MSASLHVPPVNLSNIFARKDPDRSCSCFFAGEFQRETPDVCHPEAFPAVASTRQVTFWKFKLNISYSMNRAVSTALTEGTDVFHASNVRLLVFMHILIIKVLQFNYRRRCSPPPSQVRRNTQTFCHLCRNCLEIHKLVRPNLRCLL